MTGAPPTMPDCQKPLPGAPVIGFSDLLCHVRMFKPQFAPLVESGVKCQTVRPTPKRMPKAGDRISLRMWTGKPYRSKQRVLRESEIAAVQVVRMTETDMWLDGVRQTGNQNWEFALADGFRSSREMCDWFAATHGLPFDGVVIKWHNAALCRPAGDAGGAQGNQSKTL